MIVPSLIPEVEYSTAPAKLEFPGYLLKHGRVPTIGDDPPPWCYRGWLLWYVQRVEMHVNGENSRWAYMLEIHETGRLPDRAIPRVEFGEPDRTVFADLERWSSTVGYDCGGWSDFRDLLAWLEWGLALSKEKPTLYRKDADEQLYRGVDLGRLLLAPYDYFGAFVSERKARGWNPTAFFPTPHNVCECMVRMLFCHEERDTRTLTVNEPCLGTGRMLLHASNFSLRLSGQDVDPMVLSAARINGALYAPWMSYGLPKGLFPEPEYVPPRPEPTTPVMGF